jgi:TRAP transporter TAXI family solute receptor
VSLPRHFELNANMSDDPDDGNELKVDQALLDFMRRFDAGNPEDRETFLKEHPEIADQLRVLLEAADWIENMAGPTVAELAAGGPVPNGSQTGQSMPLDDIGLDPNAMTLPMQRNSSDTPKASTAPSLPLPGPIPERSRNARKSISIDDSTLPPNEAVADFSLTNLPNLDNSQSVLPYRFGDYILERVLGRGGMGVVYLAFQVQLERRVAIKMIRSGALASDDEVNRFYTEARSAASLTHPSIVTVYHCGEHDGHHYFSMDFIPGTDLAKRIVSGPMTPMEAVRYVRDVARAIDYAHQQGVVHRDLKPANVLIDESDCVVITDFGLAKQMGSDKGLTATGATLGTPSYMSPEQAAGKSEEQDESTDVYAIGAILFALLTGKPPFQGESVLQTIMQVIHRPAPTVRQIHPNIHADLDTIVTKCLEKSPARRYASAGDLADDLDRFYQGVPITARPPSFLRRAKHWLVNVPLIAAVTGSRNIEPTASQRWAQNIMIACVFASIIAWFTGGRITEYWHDSILPRHISIASGNPGGMYYEIAGKLAERLQLTSGSEPHVLATNGSLENIRQLLDQKAHLALMQESSVRSDQQVAVVAPLFYEAIHILVPKNSQVEHMDQLIGKKIVMGMRDSGTRQAASRLLKHFNVTEDNATIVDSDWTHAESNKDADALIAVIKVGQTGINDLLKDGRFRLLSIDNATALALEEPMFRLFEIPATAYSSGSATSIQTLATTALLVVRRDAPSKLVDACLNAIYKEDPTSIGIIPFALAANWQGLPYHDAARRFFTSAEGNR